MTYVRNAQVVKATKLVESIDLGFTKDCNLTKVFVDLENSDNSKDNSQVKSTLI